MNMQTNGGASSYKASSSDKAPSGGNYQLNDSYEEGSNSLAQSTFRDTEIEEREASHLMQIQSIASIINNPKSDNFYQQMKSFLNKKDSLEYKPMTEDQVPETSALPRISTKDFKEYFLRIQEPMKAFELNHSKNVN